MIEEIDTMPDGSSKLKVSSLLILGGTVIILLMFVLFGTGTNSSKFTGSVTGSLVQDNDDVADIETKSVESEKSATPSIDTVSKYKLVSYILKLKNLDKTTNRLQFAESVSKISDYIDGLGSRKVEDKWNSMLGCLETGCNEMYYELLDVVLENAFTEDGDKENFIKQIFSSNKNDFMPELLKDVVGLKRAVDTSDIVGTSREMVAVNTLISKVDSTEINDQWNELVNCDLKCPYYDNILLKLTSYQLESLN